METKKARQLTPDDLGRVVTVHDAVYTEIAYYRSTGCAGRTIHKLAAVTEVLTSLGASGEVKPGKIFNRPKTVDVRLGSMRLEVAANSIVELAPRATGKGKA